MTKTKRRKREDKERTLERRKARSIKLQGYLDTVLRDTEDDNYFYQKRGVQL